MSADRAGVEGLDLPPDWETQVARAYSVFSTDPGAGEFAFNFTKEFLSEKAKGQVRNALGLFEKQAGGTDEKGRKLGRDGRPIRARLPASFARAPKIGNTISPVAMRQPPGGPGRAESANDWLTEGQPLPEPAPRPKAGLGDRLKQAGKGLAEKGLEQALVPKDIREANAEQRRLAAQVLPDDGPRTPGKDPSPGFDRIATSGGLGEQRRYRLHGYPKYELIQDDSGKWHAFRGRTNIGSNYDDPRRAESDIGAWQSMRHPRQAAVVKAVEDRIGGTMTYLGEFDEKPSIRPTKGTAFRGRDGALQVWTETETQPDGQWMRFDEDYFRSQGVDDPDAAGSGAVGGEGSVNRRDDLAKKPDGRIKDVLRWMFWPPKQEKRGRGGGGGGRGGGGGGRRPKVDAEDVAEGAEPAAPRDPMDGFTPQPEKEEDPSKPRPIDGSLTPPKVHKAEDGYEIEESGTSVMDPPDKQPEYTARRPDGKEIGRHKTAKAARRAIDEDRARAAIERSRDEFIKEHDGNSNPMVQRIVDVLKERHDVEIDKVGQLAGDYKEYLQGLDTSSGLPVDSDGNTVTDDPLLLEKAADQIYGLVREMASRQRAGEKPNPEKRTPESMPREPKPGAPSPAVPAPAPRPGGSQPGTSPRPGGSQQPGTSPRPGGSQQPGTRPPDLRPPAPAPRTPATPAAQQAPEWDHRNPNPDWRAGDTEKIPGIPESPGAGAAEKEVRQEAADAQEAFRQSREKYLAKQREFLAMKRCYENDACREEWKRKQRELGKKRAEEAGREWDDRPADMTEVRDRLGREANEQNKDVGAHRNAMRAALEELADHHGVPDAGRWWRKEWNPDQKRRILAKVDKNRRLPKGGAAQGREPIADAGRAAPPSAPPAPKVKFDPRDPEKIMTDLPAPKTEGQRQAREEFGQAMAKWREAKNRARATHAEDRELVKEYRAQEAEWEARNPKPTGTHPDPGEMRRRVARWEEQKKEALADNMARGTAVRERGHAEDRAVLAQRREMEAKAAAMEKAYNSGSGTPPARPAAPKAPAEPPDWAGNGPPPVDFDVDNIPGIPPARTDEQRQARSTLRWQAQEWRNSLDQMERLPKALQSLEREKQQWLADNPAPSRHDFTGPDAAGEHRAALATWKSDKKDMEEAAADRASRIRSSLQFNKDRAAARSEDFAKEMDDIAGEGGYTGPKWWRGESAGLEAQNVPEPGPTNAPEPSLPAPSGPEPAGGSRPYTLQRGESISLTPDANGLRSVTKDGRVIKRVRNDGTVIPVEPEPEVEAAPERPPRVRRPPRRGGSA